MEWQLALPGARFHDKVKQAFDRQCSFGKGADGLGDLGCSLDLVLALLYQHTQENLPLGLAFQLL